MSGFPAESGPSNVCAFMSTRPSHDQTKSLDWRPPQSVSSGVPRCLTPISYRIHQDRFVPARSALEGALFEARSLRRDACNPHVFAAYRTRTGYDWKLGLNGGLRCVHGYYPPCAAPSEYCAALGRKICSILRIRTDISDEELEAYVNGDRGLEH